MPTMRGAVVSAARSRLTFGAAASRCHRHPVHTKVTSVRALSTSRSAHPSPRLCPLSFSSADADYHHRPPQSSPWQALAQSLYPRRRQRYGDQRYLSSGSNISSGGSTSNGLPDGKAHHDLFQKQMQELEEERQSLFGDDDTSGQHGNPEEEEGGRPPMGDYRSSSPSSQSETVETLEEETEFNPDDDTRSPSTLTPQQREDMYEARDFLYGFTSEEKANWSNAGGSGHTHSKELMEAIRLAREREERVLVKDGRRVGDTSAGGGAEVGAKMEQQQQPQQQQQQQHTFTHLTPSGQSVSMVDVGSKQITRRIAVARSSVVFPPEVMEAFHLQGGESEEMVGPKGPIFASAKIAGIMGAKRTHELIPLCHPLPLDKVDVQISLHDNTAIIECECRVTHKTGVEMEALTGATVAALTIYDMCKAVSHNIAIGETVLVRKEGGKRTVRGQTLMK